MKLLKRPYLNSFILGVLIGLPQGLTIIEKHTELLLHSKLPSFHVVLFGLFAPSILSMFLPKEKSKKKLVSKYIEYIRPNYIVIWMALSLSISSAIMIYRSNNHNFGYGIPLFFGSVGIGYLLSIKLLKELKRI